MILALGLALALAGGASEPPLVEVAQPSIEAEARLCGRADHRAGVLDGDTLDVVVTRIADERAHAELRCTACLVAQRVERQVHGHTQVRLGGGLDAPEARETGGRETREFLLGLLGSTQTLYLDIDDGARGCAAHVHPGRDNHCRLLAKLYVRRGDTYVDVNATLVRWGRAHYPHHDWMRYANKPSEFAASAVSSPNTTNGENDPVVWITRSGTHYHREGCASLSRSKTAVPRSAARARGFVPCGACKPG